MYEFSERLKALPPYLFIEIDRMKQKAVQNGKEIINLGVGDPDIPTPELIRDRMCKAVNDFDNHQYPLGKGKDKFRIEVHEFMKKRFGVELDKDTQIHPLIGSKEGLAHFPLAFVNPNDTVIISEPSYPVYNSGTIFAGGKPYFVPLLEENDFLPDWDKVPEDILNRAKVLFINYPNNPTGALAPREFFEKTVKLADKYGFIIAHDAAYSELYFKHPPLSLFQIDGAIDLGIEFHSLSKTFSMTGWRIGWACGNEKLIKGIGLVKDNIDSGVFGAIQDAGTEALSYYQELTEEIRDIYRERMQIMVDGLNLAGWKLNKPQATFYIWTRPPHNVSSIEAVKKIVTQAGIICTPGSGFGPSGEGYVRFALTRNVQRIKEAVKRIKEIKW